MPISTSDYRDAAELISVPERWSSDCLAQDAYGNRVYPLSPTAVRWDAIGALCHVTGVHRSDMSVLLGNAQADALSYINAMQGRLPAIIELWRLGDIEEKRGWGD